MRRTRKSNTCCSKALWRGPCSSKLAREGTSLQKALQITTPSFNASHCYWGRTNTLGLIKTALFRSIIANIPGIGHHLQEHSAVVNSDTGTVAFSN